MSCLHHCCFSSHAMKITPYSLLFRNCSKCRNAKYPAFLIAQEPCHLLVNKHPAGFCAASQVRCCKTSQSVVLDEEMDLCSMRLCHFNVCSSFQVGLGMPALLFQLQPAHDEYSPTIYVARSPNDVKVKAWTMELEYTTSNDTSTLFWLSATVTRLRNKVSDSRSILIGSDPRESPPHRPRFLEDELPLTIVVDVTNKRGGFQIHHIQGDMLSDEDHRRHVGLCTTDWECVICMRDREDEPLGDEWVQLPCNHMFHEPCILRWLTESQSFTCPSCRNYVDPSKLGYCDRVVHDYPPPIVHKSQSVVAGGRSGVSTKLPGKGKNAVQNKKRTTGRASQKRKVGTM